MPKSPNDCGSGSALDAEAQVAPLVHELGEHLDGTYEVEEELLDKLLAVVGVSAKEISTVECDELILPPTGEAEPLSNILGGQW